MSELARVVRVDRTSPRSSHRATTAVLLVLSAALGGCLYDVEAGEDPGLRLGTWATYEYTADGYVFESTRTAERVVDIDFPGFACQALIVNVTTVARSEATMAPEGPPTTFTRNLCLDGTYRTVSIFEREGLGYVTHIRKNLPVDPVTCLLLCSDLPDEGLDIDGSVPPYVKSEHRLLRNGTSSPLFVHEWRSTFGACVSEGRTDFDLSEGPFPQTVPYASTRSCGSEPPVHSLRVQALIGAGLGAGDKVTMTPSDPLPLPSDMPTPVDWGDRPVEQASPFRFPQEDAVSTLRSTPEGAVFFATHDDAFLAAATYREYESAETGQTEWLWVFLWKQGTDALWAECHRLTTPFPDQGDPLTPLVVDECYDVALGTSAVPQNRSHYGPAALSWEAAVAYWRTLVGDEVELTGAIWSTVDEVARAGLPNSASRAPAASEPFMAFDYAPGTFETAIDAPAWLGTHAGEVVRAHRSATTVFDATSGELYDLVSPRPPGGLNETL